MFVGHLGVGFMDKRAYPRPSLATYFVATELPDFLWSLFVLAGWEQVLITPGETVVTPAATMRTGPGQANGEGT